MKKTQKFILIFLTVCVVLFVAVVNFTVFASDGSFIEDTRSKSAIFWDEQVVPKLVNIFLSGSTAMLVISIVLKWLLNAKKGLEKVGEQFGLTNEQLLSLGNYIKNLVENEFKTYVQEFNKTQTRFKLSQENIDEFTRNVSRQVALLETGQNSIIQMLKIAFSNDKELVRLGVASEINKLAYKYGEANGSNTEQKEETKETT